MKIAIASSAAVILATIGLAGACGATVNLGIFLQSQSPDGRMVEVNGGIWSDDANILGWTYDWNDGTANTGWFPMIHRYGWPGDFTVTVTGYDDTGDTAVAQLVVTVPEPDPTDVVFVQIEPGAWSIKDTDSLEVRLHAFDAYWQPLSMAGRAVEVWYPGAGDFVDVGVRRDTLLMVTAKPLGERDYAWSSIYVYVDGAPGMDAMNLMTNKHPGSFAHHHFWWVGSYLPDTFFVACSLSVEEYCHVNDLAFEADLVSTYGKNANQGDRSLFQGISYAPPVYGASGNPIGLGDYSIPVGGRPYFNVIFHEMGHNFSGVNHLFNCIGMPGPFYQETIGEWYVQYNIDEILANHSGELSAEAIAMLEGFRDEGRVYHLSEYYNYLNGGCQFDYMNISTSHALVEKIYEYCDGHGWDRITLFLDFFEHGRLYDYSQIMANHGGIGNDTNRVTFLLAALTYAFGTDVRADFVPLNFPIDDSLYSDLLVLWGGSVKPGEPRQEAAGSAMVLYQNRPNPAAGTTEIRYWLANPTEISLGLYDVAGREVARIDSGVRLAGLNRCDLVASNLSSGVYFLRLAGGGLAEQRKMVITK